MAFARGTRLNEKPSRRAHGARVHACSARTHFFGDRLGENAFERWLSNSIWRRITIWRWTCHCVFVLAHPWLIWLPCACQFHLKNAFSLTSVPEPILPLFVEDGFFIARELNCAIYRSRNHFCRISSRAIKKMSSTNNGIRSSVIYCSRWFVSSLERPKNTWLVFLVHRSQKTPSWNTICYCSKRYRHQVYG